MITNQQITKYVNGISYWWNQSKGSYNLGGEGTAATARALLRFEDTHRYVPAGAVVESAELTVTFLNPKTPTLVQACFMAKNWSYWEDDKPGCCKFNSTGWRYSRWNGSASLNWTEPGGWADCSPAANISFVVPSDWHIPYWPMTLSLDPGMVRSWLGNNGSANYGLMFRAVNGSADIVTSTFVNGTLRRPALTIAYNTDAGATQPAVAYPVNITTQGRTWWVSEKTGDDDWNSGHEELPFRSLVKGLNEAWAGDKIYLMNGTYAGALFIQRGGVTIQSAPGHWAVIASPRSDPRTAVNVITIYSGVDYGTLADVEVVGGHYYGVQLMTNISGWATPMDNYLYATAPSHWTFRNVRFHGTGSNAVKMSHKSVNVTFTNCEFYDAGARLRTYGNAIEATLAYDLRITDCYFHDLPGAAVLLAGGSARVTLERNYIARTERGLEIGGWTDPSTMDSPVNPLYYEAINVTAANNIMVAVAQAGVVLRAANRVTVAHNTLWRVQELGQSAVFIDGAWHWPPGKPANQWTPSAGIALVGNLLVKAPAGFLNPLFQIRTGGLDNATAPPGAPAGSSGLIMAYNVYYDQAGLGPTNGTFTWGKGAMLEDARAGSKFVGNATGWARFCSLTLGQPLCDLNSTEADPQLKPDFTPLACSPAAGRVPSAAMPLAGVANVTTDFHGRPRPAGRRDAGAVQSGAAGAAKVLPPVPAAFRAFPPYNGTGLPAFWEKVWPYLFWQPRVCKDLIVDLTTGNDNQPFDYYANYQQPFLTLATALSRSGMCDRILLRGGQTHAGFVTITQTNVTVTTHPADLAPGGPGRAQLLCNGTVTSPCIYVYKDATALNVSNLDVVMAGGASGSCMHFDGGAGSGGSPLWDFFVATSGRVPPEGWDAARTTFFTNISFTNCGTHGTKLSTFVRRVWFEGLKFTGTGDSGFEVVGGSDVTIRRCRISGTRGSGIRLGGGARNLRVERNYIQNFGGAGILLGSEGTAAPNTDTDWALNGAASAPDWHDCINATVINNIIENGTGAGVAFFSARDAVVAHNTILNVSAGMQAGREVAGVLFNVSPKQTGNYEEAGPPNVNITFANNIITLPAGTFLRMPVQARMLQGAVVQRQLNVSLPAGNCSGVTATTTTTSVTGRRRLLSHQAQLLRGGSASQRPESAFKGTFVDGLIGASDGAWETSAGFDRQSRVPTGSGEQDAYTFHPEAFFAERRRLAAVPQSFTQPYVAAKGSQGRNADGSCPFFPDSNPWHTDVSGLAVHPRSEAIKSNIGLKNLHIDFGFQTNIGGRNVPAGMPINIVDSSKGTKRVNITWGPSGYGDPRQLDPLGAPLPADAAVQGSYPGCGDPPCWGDRHLILVDNATCTLYEGWRAFPPSVTNTTKWQVEALLRYNLLNNSLGHELGATSADAAGLPILPGLVTYDEVVVKGVINHALRFTGPVSRPAYAMPGTHFAAAGNCTTRDCPYMAMRVRLRAAYNCSQHATAARVFCMALQKYGAFFADNGLPWDFAGEATAKWDAVWNELKEVMNIPSSAMEVLDPGCICLDGGCTVAECNGMVWLDPNSPSVYPAIAKNADVRFVGNIYYKPNATGLFVDQRLPPFGTGYAGGLAGWAAYIGETGSVEANPLLNATSYYPTLRSPARGNAVRLPAVREDFYGRCRGDGTNTDIGAVLY
ncbi:hypothetical protein GPECTOR_15g511 [Gonium pectorale]|uniref:Right handed beta helix domain-containing protein n=1 Tax=Gonium pectorale TaxID=33097 RepID=A0A150GM49_GONPE|nr:hypothetical protein GPECTOR_15g511 [Gonium pectorale]|eukprot:KXZ50825.1 hypothetical protein GPECTOR_15g511 [Gonium pectorale]